MTKELKPHDRTRRVMVGDVPVGGGAPVAVQSMLNAPADDVAANLAQIEALAEAGCEIVRMAIPRRDCLDAFEAVCAASPLPVVADIHFDARIAIEAAARGAAKLRINPGNIGGLEATREVIAAASAAGIPIRIFEGDVQTFYYSVMYLPKDPMILCHNEFFAITSHTLLDFLQTLDSRKYLVLKTDYFNRPNHPPIPLFVIRQK